MGALKEGGHHRRGVDVLRAKKATKAQAKACSERNGELTRTLTRLLQLDPLLDVYLEAGPDDAEDRAPCPDHFWRESCSSRRCSLSHALTLHGVRPSRGGPAGAGTRLLVRGGARSVW